MRDLRLFPGGEHLANATNGRALLRAQGEKLKAMVQTLAITHQGAKFQGVGGQGKGKLHGYDFASFQLSGEGAANAILSAVGYNFRRILAWLRALLRLFLIAIARLFIIRSELNQLC